MKGEKGDPNRVTRMVRAGSRPIREAELGLLFAWKITMHEPFRGALHGIVSLRLCCFLLGTISSSE